MIKALTMRFSEIVLATVTNVENMTDFQSFDHVGILSVMPITEPKSSGENLIRVAVSNVPEINCS